MMLHFDPATHTYTLNGERLPSVTQALSVLTADYYDRIPQDRLEYKRQIGTAVDTAIQLDLAGNLDLGSVAVEWAGYFRAWRAFVLDTRLSEEDIGPCQVRGSHSIFRYAGTRDITLRINQIWSLLDFKCSWGLHPAVGPQTAAYLAIAAAQREERFPRLRYALHLKEDGKYRLEPLTDPTDFQTFLSCLNVYRWKEKHL